MQSAISTHRSAIFLLLSLAALPLAAGVSNITQHTWHETITGAVDSATSGDVLNIATGTYAGNVSIQGMTLTLLGGFDMDCATPVAGKPVILVTSGIGVNIGSGSTCILSNLVVAGAQNSGMYVHDTANATCYHCVITNNASLVGGGVDVRVRASLLLVSCDVGWNRSTYWGGGAYVRDGGMLTLDQTDCSIHDNYAPEGGGAYVEIDGVLTLQDAGKIYKNTAALRGGGVCVSNASLVVTSHGAIGWWGFNQNVVTNGDGGGVHAMDGATVWVGNNGQVAGNTASGNGGGIFLEDATLDVNYGRLGLGSPIYTNFAVRDGGNVYAWDGSTVIIQSNSAVLGGWARNGGGVYASNSTVQILSGTILGSSASNDANVAAETGGGLFAAASTVALDTATVLNNRAFVGGGCELGDATVITVTNTLVAGNVAGGDSGGFDVWSPGMAATVATFDQVVISNNVANTGIGGGITWWSASNLVVRNSRIVGNYALVAGGIYVQNNGSLIMRNTDVMGNMAYTHGGGIVILGSALDADGCSISGNSADFGGTTNGYGGGINFGPNSQGRLTAESAPFICDNNHAIVGGGMFLFEGVTVTVTAVSGQSAEFYGNSAMGEGGGASLISNAVLIAEGLVQFVANTASNGAGLHLLNGSLVMSASNDAVGNIAANIALKDGGGLYLDGGAAAAHLDGVHVGAWGGNVAECNDFGNGGGGVALFNGASLDAINCLFENNASTNNGGAIYVASGAATISADFTGLGPLSEPPCVFRNNRAGGNGGALHVAINTARIAVEDALIVSNSASDGGAGYVMDGRLDMVNAVAIHNDGTHSLVGFGAAQMQITHCTIADNAGGGVQVMNMLAMTNCIVWGNSGTQVSGGAGSDVSFCDVQGGGMTGMNNIDADPLFADTTALNFRLSGGSPCINTGAPLAGVVTNDCIGVERPQLGAWDMGAYEFVPEPAAAALLVIGVGHALRFHSLLITRRKMSVRHTHFV